MPLMFGVYFLNQCVTNLTNAEHATSIARQGEAPDTLETTFRMWTNSSPSHGWLRFQRQLNGPPPHQTMSGLQGRAGCFQLLAQPVHTVATGKKIVNECKGDAL